MTTHNFIMGPERAFLYNLFEVPTWLRIQAISSVIVLIGCIAQLHVDRKFNWPYDPGKLASLGFRVGLWLSSPNWAIKLGAIGEQLDIALVVLGRLGIAGQGVFALFAIDDALSGPIYPRPLFSCMMVAITFIQAWSLNVATPPDINKLTTKTVLHPQDEEPHK